MDLHNDNQKDKGITPLQYNPDLFHNDREFYLAYRKIEHIVSAIFLVTSLIEGNDLLKNAIREHALECLSKFTALIGKSGVGVTDIQSVASRILHLNALLDIGFWSGQVSQMNLAILQKEISTAYQILNDLSLKYRNNYFITSDFFKDNEQISESVGEIKQKDKGQEIKRQDIKDTSKRQAVKQQPDASKGQRREAILALLRQKANLTVKDFTSVVSEYSEKTIQRELLALVDEGVVKKEGERRWSTYSLTQ